MSIPYCIGNSILDDTSSVIYRKGKIMYHLDLPYRKMYDSDHYSICTEIQETGDIQRNKGRRRENVETVMSTERDRDNRSKLCPDHIHKLISIPPKYSVAQIMGYLKGKSSLMIFEKYANMKQKYGNRHFLVQRILCRNGRTQ